MKDSTSLCPPSSPEETLRLFVSLLSARVAGSRDTAEAEAELRRHQNSASPRNGSTSRSPRPSPRLRALLSKNRQEPCFACVNNPIAISSDESSVDDSFLAAREETEPSLFPSLAVFKPTSTTSSPSGQGSGMNGQYDYNSTQSKDISSSSALQTAYEVISFPIPTSSQDVPAAMLDMTSRALDSFAFLTVANTKQFFKIQLERHRQESPKDVRDRAENLATSYLTSMTSTQSDIPIDVSYASSSFQLVDMSTAEEKNIDGTICLKANLVFNLLIDATVYGAKTNAIITAPATIHAYFQPGGDNLIDRFELTVDAAKYLLSMRNQARAMVFKSVSHNDFPVVSGTHESSVLSDHVQSESGSKMCKLALCASLELASVIAEDTSALREPPKPTKKAAVGTTKPNGSKRRLSLKQSSQMLAVPPNKRRAAAPKKAGVHHPTQPALVGAAALNPFRSLAA